MFWGQASGRVFGWLSCPHEKAEPQKFGSGWFSLGFGEKCLDIRICFVAKFAARCSRAPEKVCVVFRGGLTRWTGGRYGGIATIEMDIDGEPPMDEFDDLYPIVEG